MGENEISKNVTDIQTLHHYIYIIIGIIPQKPYSSLLTNPKVRTMSMSVDAALAGEIFDHFCNAGTLKSILRSYRLLVQFSSERFVSWNVVRIKWAHV